jgi:hypothetical protein
MKFLKWILVPFIAFAAFVIYGYMLNFLSQLIPIPDKSNKAFLLIMLMLPHFLASAFIAVLCAYLLTFFYKNKAVLVSFFVALPAIVVALSELSNISNPTVSTLVVFYEMLTYLTLMLACSFIVSKQAKPVTNHSSETVNLP